MANPSFIKNNFIYDKAEIKDSQTYLYFLTYNLSYFPIHCFAGGPLYYK